MKLMINDILKEKKKTKYWLSKELGITKVNALRLANCKTQLIHFSLIEKLCDVLECTPNDLFKIDKAKKKESK